MRLPGVRFTVRIERIDVPRTDDRDADVLAATTALQAHSRNSSARRRSNGCGRTADGTETPLFAAGRNMASSQRRKPRESPLIIATWNVNSVRQRLPHLLDYLKEQSPDALCLQETKCLDEAFPRAEIEDLGYNVATHGQKGFNGVAILAKRPFEVARGLPGDPNDEQSRYIEAVIPTDGGAVRLACIYLPNGNPAPGEKYAYKLAFMERLIQHAPAASDLRGAAGAGGRFQRHPRGARRRPSRAMDSRTRCSCRRPARSSASCWRSASPTRCARPRTRAGLYTFWDYQAGAWQRNNGIRIDHALFSPQAADRLAAVDIDRDMRGREKASDHVPLRITLKDLS